MGLFYKSEWKANADTGSLNIMFHKISQNSAIFMFVSLLYRGQLSKERICSSKKSKKSKVCGKHDSVPITPHLTC